MKKIKEDVKVNKSTYRKSAPINKKQLDTGISVLHTV